MDGDSPTTTEAMGDRGYKPRQKPAIIQLRTFDFALVDRLRRAVAVYDAIERAVGVGTISISEQGIRYVEEGLDQDCDELDIEDFPDQEKDPKAFAAIVKRGAEYYAAKKQRPK